MAEIEEVEILTYEDWRERLMARAGSTGWKISNEVRQDAIKRLVASIQNPSTPFQSFIKAVDMLAKLERAENQAVSNAFKVTQWAVADFAAEKSAENGVRSQGTTWTGPFQEELDRLADRMMELGLSKDLVDQVRNFDLCDLPESADPEKFEFAPSQRVGEGSV
jgi:hypothetical protein